MGLYKFINILFTNVKNNGLWYTLCKILKKISERKRFYNLSISYDLLENKNQQLNIAFNISGGMGDYLIFFNYLSYFLDLLEDCRYKIDIYAEGGLRIIEHIFNNTDLIKVYNTGIENYNKYDLGIYLLRFPEIKKMNRKRIQYKAPQLISYLAECNDFYFRNINFFVANGIYTGGQTAWYCVKKGQTRLQQPDINRYLHISNEYRYNILIDKDEKKYLEEHGLCSRKYITIHHGCDGRHEVNMKLWSVKNYYKLVNLIKSKYPEYSIVQCGINKERFPDVPNVDVNLVGKTSLEDVKILLKNSLLHIDNEGGMVHLRHALHGGTSIVVFGPTLSQFFGYQENYNICKEKICEPCEWVVDHWMEKCLKNESSIPACMEAITPLDVMKCVDDFFCEENK